VRVSSEEQADSGLGLQAQRQRIAAFCEMKGLRLADVYEDAGVSGGKPLSSRPSGSRLLNAARRGAPIHTASVPGGAASAPEPSALVLAGLGVGLVAAVCIWRYRRPFVATA
jgi:hypothetical protein